MTAPFSGGCACGCFIVLASDVEITGTPKTHSVRASSGSLATRSFCSDCGGPLFTRGEAAPEFMSIRFPTLDNPSEFQPMLDIWTSSAQPWVCLSQEIPQYPQSPRPG